MLTADSPSRVDGIGCGPLTSALSGKLNRDPYLLFKTHPCSHGLSEQACQEIASAAEVLVVEPGHAIHQRDQAMTDVFLIVHGRLKQDVYDVQGKVLLSRYQVAGGQFGALSAALGEPMPIDSVAEDPSTLLRFDYSRCLELTKKHDRFRLNWLRILATSIKSNLFQDRSPIRPRMIGLFHQSAETRPLTKQLLGRLQALGEAPCLLTDDRDCPPLENVRMRVAPSEGEEQLGPAEIRRLVGEWSADSERVVCELATSYDLERSGNLVEVCEQVFWCVTAENWQASIPVLRKLLERSPGWRNKINLVWLLNGGEAPLAAELRELVVRDFKICYADRLPEQGSVLSHGIQRLIQFLRGVQIGVALGGGAARGMAHLGVLKVLEQNGIVVDRIAGTSAGAMTGIVYGSGMAVDYAVDRFVNDLRPSWFFRHLPRGENWYLLYKYRTGQFDPMLRKYLGNRRLEQLPLPVHSITVDLVSGQAVTRDAGDAVHGIIESINLPVLAPPINREGQALVDGGLINNVPADVLVSRGCNFVIAVSVTNKMEHEFANNRPDTPTASMKRASTLQTVLRSYLVQSVNMNSIGVQPADIVIEPDVSNFQLTEFAKTDQLSAVGEETALESVQQIKEMLSHLDNRLYPSP
ncbi:MAG: cyclic nucleotide-binding and patatin-like phospholipase domain-containing protein [Planctomycetota bacterium]|nr:cyclic nucleotide-binding and patatin-like phospholipase domain-containing protein [Planctomycetota bacterium]